MYILSVYLIFVLLGDPEMYVVNLFKACTFGGP